jgi:hypothetical protein
LARAVVRLAGVTGEHSSDSDIDRDDVETELVGTGALAFQDVTLLGAAGGEGGTGGEEAQCTGREQVFSEKKNPKTFMIWGHTK